MKHKSFKNIYIYILVVLANYKSIIFFLGYDSKRDGQKQKVCYVVVTLIFWLA